MLEMSEMRRESRIWITSSSISHLTIQFIPIHLPLMELYPQRPLFLQKCVLSDHLKMPHAYNLSQKRFRHDRDETLSLVQYGIYGEGRVKKKKRIEKRTKSRLQSLCLHLSCPISSSLTTLFLPLYRLYFFLLVY